MDLTTYNTVLSTTLETVALGEDSLFEKATAKMQAYLTEHTSLSDNEKAKQYSAFFQQLVTSLTAQATVAAQEVAIKGPLAESEILVNAEKVHLTAAQTAVELERISFMKEQVKEMSAKVQLIGKQIELEAQKIAIEKLRIPLLSAQIKNEEERTKLTAQQIEVEREKVALTHEQILLAGAELYYKRMQAEAVREANLINKVIEREKNATAITIARINAGVI